MQKVRADVFVCVSIPSYVFMQTHLVLCARVQVRLRARSTPDGVVVPTDPSTLNSLLVYTRDEELRRRALEAGHRCVAAASWRPV